MKKYFPVSVLIAAAFIFTAQSAFSEEVKVIPVGKAVGIQIYTDGLTVIGTSDVSGVDAARKNGIRVNDRIISVNGAEAGTSEEFAKAVNENPDGLELVISRDNRNISVNAVPVKSEDNVYRLGLWVRDSCAGVGTVTYYNPASKTFAALGHAVNDVDTGNILTAKTGNILNCSIVSVTKSLRGMPGEINAAFGDLRLGEISANTRNGIFGICGDNTFENENRLYPVAAKEQIHEGEAFILSDIFAGKTQDYSINIEKITNDDDKGLVIEVTDPRLTEQTGGIVQGMSGSPIIQDGRLIGAVTHVFVNNPQKGYGTLAERMIDTERKELCMAKIQPLTAQ